MELQASVYMSALRQTIGTLTATTGQRPSDGGVEDKVPTDGVVPADIVRFLARLRLLEGVPFPYLVPEADLTPPETIRFFYIDRNATDALVEGSLSVGTANSADRVQLAELYSTVRDEVDVAERLVRMKDSDAAAVDAAGRPIGVGGPITGFVLRSRLVSGWPAMHVRAYSKDDHPDDLTGPDADDAADRVRLLRMERLAPAVLLVLFDGIPAVVQIEEPRAGIQFGIRRNEPANGQQSAYMPLRDVTHPNNGFLTAAGNPVIVPVQFRRGSPGVINIRQLNADMAKVAATNMGSTVDPSEFAMQMLRFPLRQVFGAAKVDQGYDAFVATIPVAQLTERFALAARVLR